MIAEITKGLPPTYLATRAAGQALLGLMLSLVRLDADQAL